jgi:alpha-ketoglutarate-dependent taurine dioxygenase
MSVNASVVARPSVRPVGEGFVAEVSGLDLSAPLDDDAIEWIADRLDEYALLVFRGQDLDAAALDRFSRRFGTPQKHVLERYRHPDIPEISYVTNVAADGSVDRFGVRRATIWHSDATYEAKLPRLAMLHALEVPAQGGGTWFADLRAAWDALPVETRERLLPLTGQHRFNRGPANSAGIYDGQDGVREAVEEVQHHPAAAVHPRSGRRILFVNPAHSVGFDGMDRDEGWKLVEDLSTHAMQDRFTHRHDWRPGDLVIWDERATMHRGAGDSRPEERRVLIRAIVY